MFREPFSPPSASTEISEPLLIWEKPTRGLSSTQRSFVSQHINEAEAPLLIIGNIEDPDERTAALEIAKKLSWPTICDVSSGLSLFNIENKISAFHLLSQLESIKPLLSFDFVLHIGGNTVIKNIGAQLKYTQYLQVDPRPKQHQPMIAQMIRFNLPIAALKNISTPLKILSNNIHTSLSKISKHCSELVKEQDKLSEFSSMSLLLSLLTSNHILFVSNSLPIRVLNRLHYNISAETASNRGASGIDGTISSALGWITGKKYTHPEQKGILVIGDLSFWHELGSLLHYQNEDLLIILINNGGGGIFHFLPIAQEKSLLTKYFATHHTQHFSQIAEKMGCEALQVSSEAELKEALITFLPQNNLRLIEIIVDPKTTVDHNNKYKILLEKHINSLVSE